MHPSPIQGTYKFVGHQVILRIRDRVCENTDEMLSSALFREVLTRFITDLTRRHSPLMSLFHHSDDQAVSEVDIEHLIHVYHLLARMPCDWAEKLLSDDNPFLREPSLLHEFNESLYDFWREFERFIVCDSEGDALDKRPYRTFNRTIESLTHIVRSAYRDIQENISGKHPTIYRQITAGAEMAAIALPKELQIPPVYAKKLDGISLVRQILIYPPLLLHPPTNKRSGQFVRISKNPLDWIELNPGEWLCYPAKVGPLLILIYFHEQFSELGFSLCNLFEMAEDEFLEHKADAVFLFGVQEDSLDGLGKYPTVVYDDDDNGILVGAIPRRLEYGYFGYLKKMTLTLHNIAMLKRGRLPYHGAMVRFRLKGGREITILIMGDTGTGKSETLEAFRALGEERIREMMIIADDMGSLEIVGEEEVLGYGSEVGAFVRLDDLHPGYAFGHLDRTIIMNPGQVNARVVLPVTSYENVIMGQPVDVILYANNYEPVDDDHPVIQRFTEAESALQVFRQGQSMSKGTTTSTGLVQTYFTNIFGPLQYPEIHDELADKYFHTFFASGKYVGQLRTRLGLPGWERKGPEEAARALLELILVGLAKD